MSEQVDPFSSKRVEQVVGEIQESVNAPADAATRIGCLPIATVVLAAALLVVGCPPIRDWLLGAVYPDSRQWITRNKSAIVSWVEYTRIFLEIVLALSVSSLIFNKEIQNWAKKKGGSLAKSLINKSIEALKEQSLPQAAAREKERTELVQEITILRESPGSLADNVDDVIWLSFRVFRMRSRHYYWINQYIVRVLWIRVLHVLNRHLLAIIASFSFLGVLIMKFVKQCADSGVFVTVAG